MLKWVIFYLLWNSAATLQLPICKGVTVETKFYDSNYDTVFTYSIDITINQTYSNRNELIFSNYKEWSAGQYSYMRDDPVKFCAAEKSGVDCFTSIPDASNISISYVGPFQVYYIFYNVIVDGYEAFTQQSFSIDKGVIYGRFNGATWAGLFEPSLCEEVPNECDVPTCPKFSYTICCNNFVNVIVPDDDESEQCLEYQTTASLFTNSGKEEISLLKFQAKYRWYKDTEIKVIDNKFSSTLYDTSDFYVDQRYLTFCQDDSDHYDCWIKRIGGSVPNDTTKLLYDFFIFTGNDDPLNTGISVSKFWIINGTIKKENFDLFTSADPCWISPTTIYQNSSLILNASFCCTKFLQPPTTTTIDLSTTKSMLPSSTNSLSTMSVQPSISSSSLASTTKDSKSTTTSSTSSFTDFYNVKFLVLLIFSQCYRIILNPLISIF